MKHLLALAALAGAFAAPLPAWSQSAPAPAIEQTQRSIPCTCRFKGQDIPVGQTMCLDLPNGPVLAQCGRVLNNTAWKTLQQGCPTPGLS